MVLYTVGGGASWFSIPECVYEFVCEHAYCMVPTVQWVTDGMMGVFYIPCGLLREEVRVDSISPVHRAVGLVCCGFLCHINHKRPGGFKIAHGIFEHLRLIKNLQMDILSSLNKKYTTIVLLGFYFTTVTKTT